MNRPITHKPDNGHCLQIMIPSARVTIPFTSTQNECWNLPLRAATIRKIPPMNRNTAINSVKASALATRIANHHETHDRI